MKPIADASHGRHRLHLYPARLNASPGVVPLPLRTTVRTLLNSFRQVRLGDVVEERGGRPPSADRPVRPVVLAIQTIDDGPSLINRAEAYASAVWRCHRPDDAEPPLWIQRQLNEPDDDESPFQLVTFTVAGHHRLTGPRWHQLTAAQVERLLGQPADGSRGDGYQPPPAEPEEIPVHEITPVADLPRPRPFRELYCMPSPNSSRRLLFWRTHPARPASCCWYHQQDWTRLSETAITLIEDAHRDGVTGCDIAPYALDKAQAAGPAADNQALHTLLAPSLAICATSAFTNGQHRVQAMRDQGVIRTITVRWHTPGAPAETDLG